MVHSNPPEEGIGRAMTMFRFTVAAIAAFALCAEAAKQPNFVILFIDDMGWRDWSGNGSDYLETLIRSAKRDSFSTMAM
jgi:hypothetical protein